MFDFLITCRRYSNSKLFSLYDIEVVLRWKDTSTRHSKSC